MECHDCPHAADVAAGVYAGADWEETPCAACMAGGGGGAPAVKRHVEYDDGVAPPSVPPPDEPLAPVMPVTVLADAVSVLLRLPRDVLEVVRLRYLGVKYREIARQVGIGRSACSMMVVRALEGQPVLAELMPRTKGRRAARRGGGKAGENREAGRRVPAVKSRVVARAARARKRT